MQNDKNTLNDLSIFTDDGIVDIFSLTDRTVTQAGKDVLRHYFLHPPDSFSDLCAVQEVVKFWSQRIDVFPKIISNGTLVMLGQFFETAEMQSTPPTGIALAFSTLFEKVFYRQEHSLLKFSLSHLRDFLSGCSQLVAMEASLLVPALLKEEVVAMKKELDMPLIAEILKVTPTTKFNELRRLRYHARRGLKHIVYRLINSYAKADAWHSMAVATMEHGWVFPELLPPTPVCFEATALYHPLLQHPVAYNCNFSESQNFLLLTGANMSGKTTYLRAVGVSALLAHIGIGVPAEGMRLSFLQSIITHIQVKDDIHRGESYFYAEVQRMKQTAEKIIAPTPCMVLMDELFKGTNVHDACDCTRAVVEGLLNHPMHIMILSTHLYEVAQQFSNSKRITFEHFITEMENTGDYRFTYQMKSGISNDRIGYRILQQEGVVKLLSQIKT